ncbi:WD40 repeat domain-containing protein [Aerosakkonema sp. BLCC-F183]|uniref:WD40 repeat domain-containing protein n=1 Tax=Aerosakkonema sp. BLCC-F183 TaxID=3342834 RepID=UPI0035BA066D
MNNLSNHLVAIPLISLSVAGLNVSLTTKAHLIAQQATCTVINIQTGQLALRFTPNGNARAGIDKGNTVALLRRGSTPWVYVRVLEGPNSQVNGLEGWVNSGYLSCGESSARIQRAATSNITGKLNPQAWQNARLVHSINAHSDNWVTSIAISSNGQSLISSGYEKTIKLWNMETGQLVRSFSGIGGFFRTIAISSNGQILASACDGIVEVWNLNTGNLLYRLSGAGSVVGITPDSQTLVSGMSDNKVKLWNLRTGDLQQALPGNVESSGHISISSDGTILAAASMFKVSLWNLRTGELIRTIESTNRGDVISTASISPDGQTLFTAKGANIQIWNIRTGELIRTLEGHSNTVNSIAISSDGQILASGSEDRTIRILNIQTRELITVISDAERVLSVKFSPDNWTLASGSKDGKIRIWQANE